MKKIAILALMVLLLLNTVSAASLIKVVLLNQDPDPVDAGDVVELRFKIENSGETTREDVSLEIIPEAPFTLYSGDLIKNLGILRWDQLGKEAAIADFKLKVDPDAADGDHAIKVRVHSGTTSWIYEDKFFIDVEHERIKLKTFVRSSDIITANSKGTISVEVANAGGYNLEFLELELAPSDDYKLLSTSPYVYLGNLDSDDTEIEDFQIYVPDGKKEVSVPVLLKYEVNDQDYEDHEVLTLNLLSTEEAKTVGLIKTSNTLTYVLLAFIVILLIVIWRKVRKRR